jgi:Rieske Fe-S protein
MTRHPKESVAMNEPNDNPRRRFLKTTAVAGAALACNGCALFYRRSLDVDAPPADREVVIHLADHPALSTEAGFIRVRARDRRLIVFRDPERGLVAADMACTHFGCDVDWDAPTRLLVCPCHGSRFDNAGSVVEGPADEPLRTYPLVDHGDHAVIDVSMI